MLRSASIYKPKAKGMASARLILMFITVFAVVAFSVKAPAQSLLPNNFTVEGRLYNTWGVPLNTTGVDVMLEVWSEANPNCVIYRERHTGFVLTADPGSNSAGVFALRLGAGIKDFPA